MQSHSTKSLKKSRYWEKTLGQGMFLTMLLFITVIAVILSGSRAGIVLALLGLIVSGVIQFARYGKLKSLGLISGIFVITMIIALNIGIVSIINRFSIDPIEDLRWQIFESTKLAIQGLLPFGSGVGTFPEIFRTHQPLDMSKFINHAHNDYYELVFDMGFLGLFIIAGFFILYGVRWLSLLKSDRSHGFMLQISIGLSLALFLVHSYVDFDFYIPFNALVFVVFSAMFFKKSLQIMR